MTKSIGCAVEDDQETPLVLVQRPPRARRPRGTRGSVNENVITKELASKPKRTSGRRFSPPGNTEMSLGSQATGTNTVIK